MFYDVDHKLPGESTSGSDLEEEEATSMQQRFYSTMNESDFESYWLNALDNSDVRYSRANQKCDETDIFVQELKKEHQEPAVGVSSMVR